MPVRRRDSEGETGLPGEDGLGIKFLESLTLFAFFRLRLDSCVV
jgi:hypothetical protein